MSLLADTSSNYEDGLRLELAGRKVMECLDSMTTIFLPRMCYFHLRG